ncbi:hypothetical protein R3P38DRAFT_2881335 [Favolaschia claudopus]|uniref:Secreted protein n=1 Tax=Favolaschia claudopus TaxID=2862362 RepID=A0AAW0D1N1_9AGAR
MLVFEIHFRYTALCFLILVECASGLGKRSLSPRLCSESRAPVYFLVSTIYYTGTSTRFRCRTYSARISIISWPWNEA